MSERIETILQPPRPELATPPQVPRMVAAPQTHWSRCGECFWHCRKGYPCPCSYHKLPQVVNGKEKKHVAK